MAYIHLLSKDTGAPINTLVISVSRGWAAWGVRRLTWAVRPGESRPSIRWRLFAVSPHQVTVQRTSVPALLLSLNNGSDRMINATIRPILPDTARTDNILNAGMTDAFRPIFAQITAL